MKKFLHGKAPHPKDYGHSLSLWSNEELLMELARRGTHVPSDMTDMLRQLVEELYEALSISRATIERLKKQYLKGEFYGRNADHKTRR